MEWTVFETVTIIVAGTMVGNELGMSIINSHLRRFEEEKHFATVRALAALFGAVMPFWYAATFLLTVIVAVCLRKAGTAAVWVDVSAALWLLSIAYSITSLVPINNRLASQEGEIRPSHWSQEWHKWDRLHVARVALLVIALASLILGCLLAQARH